MTKTGILALSTVVVVIFIIGIVGFIFAKVRLSPKVEVTPSPTIKEKVASPTAAIKEVRLASPAAQVVGGQATSSARRIVK